MAANSRRDVELVFRATDQSTSTVDRIVESVGRYNKAQKDVAAAATEEGKALLQVQARFKELDAVFRSAAGLNQIQESMKEAAAAIKATTAAQDGLKASLQQSQAAEAAQRSAVQAQADAESRLTASIRTRAQEMKTLAGAQAVLNAEAQRAQTAAQAAIRNNSVAQTAVTRAQTRTDRLRSPAAIARANSSLVAARSTAAGTQSDVVSTTAAAEAAQQAAAANAAAAARLAAAQSADNEALSALRGTMRAASSDLDALTRNTRNLQTEMSRNEKTVQNLQRAQSSLNEQYRRGAEAMSGLNSVAASQLADTAKSLVSGFKAASVELDTTSTRVAELQNAMNTGQISQAKFTAGMKEAASAADAARKKFDAYNTAIRDSARAVTGVRMGSISPIAGAATVGQSVSSVAGYESAAREAEAETAAQNKLAQARRSASDATKSGFDMQRESLSLYQRIRGQVLSLTAAYIGLEAALSAVEKIINVTQTMDSARNALTAVTGSAEAAATELDWLRRNAEKLGVSLGDMAPEYAKMSVGLKLAGISADDTRKIFLSVANAGRALHLSTADINGAFMAIEQMANKGTVQAEELRQQLGDRLPGAFELFAKAAGVSTQQLGKMMQQGQVGLDLLPKFADTLNATFSGATASALNQTAANVGRLQDAVFEFTEKVSEANGLDGFNRLLRTLNDELRSAAADQYAEEIAKGLNAMGDAANFFVQHGEAIVKIVSSIMAMKLAAYFTGIGAEMVVATKAAGGVVPALRASAGALIGLTAAEEGAEVATVGLTVALRGLAISTGIGAIFVAATMGLEAWLSKVDSGTKTLNEHKKAIDALKNAYDDSAGGAFQPEKSGQTASFWQNQISQGQDQLSSARQSALSMPTTDRDGSREVSDLIRQFQKGSIGAAEMRKSLIQLQDQIESKGGLMERGLIQNTLDGLDKYEESTKGIQKQITESKAALAAMNNTMTDADKRTLGMKSSTDEAAESAAAAAKAVADYTKALDTLRGMNPSIKEKEWDTAAAKIETAYQAALRYAKGMQDVASATAAVDKAHEQALQSINRRYGMGDTAPGYDGPSLSGTTGQTGAARLITSAEGFIGRAKVDTDGRYRVGYGSDTVTNDSGVSQTTASSSVTQTEAMRDLYRRIDEIIKSLQSSLGKTTWAGLSANQQAALVDLRYNYGDSRRLNGVMDQVRAGNVPGAAAAIRGLSTDNNGINASRRNREATVFEGSGALDQDAMEKGYQAQAKEDEAALKSQQRLNSEFDSFVRKLKVRNELNATDDARTKTQLAVQKDIADWVAKAQQAGAKLTSNQIEKLRQADTTYQSGRFNMQAAQQSTAQFAVSASAVRDARSNYRQAFDQGDFAGVRTARQELEKAQKQMEENQKSAIAMWRAVGGKNADVAIDKINSLATRSTKTSNMMKINFEKIGDYLADDMVSSTNSFISSLAQGGNVVDTLKSSFLSFATSFLTQIAQMIIQQQLLNALQSVMGGFGSLGGASSGAADAFSGAGTLATAVFHSGGIAGSTAGRKTGVGFSAAEIMSAPRMHTGGIAGLASNEQLTVLKKNEEVLTEDNPRHIFNSGSSGASSGGSPTSIRSVLVLDPKQIPTAMQSTHGETVVLQHIKANAPTIRQILKVSK